jgi:hypothetical protein
MTYSQSVAILPNRRFGVYKSVVGCFASDCGWRAWRVGRLNSRGLFNADENPGTLQPSEFLSGFVQADGWARLPVTPLNLVQVSCGELL